MSIEGKNLKILMIAPTPFFADRGTHIRILEEALALRRRGHEVKIATYHIGNDLPEEIAQGIDVRRIRRLLFWYKKLEAGPDWQKILLDLMLIRKSFNLARTWRPDVIHGHLHEGVLIGWVVKRALFWRKMTLVADFHGSLTKEMVSHAYLRGGLLKVVFGLVERIIDNLGDAAVASSWSNAKEISRIRKGGPVEVALDGARIFPEYSEEDRRAAREKYGIPQGAAVAVYTGAFISNKGITDLVRSIPTALRENESLFFVLAGFPEDQLDRTFERYGIGRHRVKVISPLPYFSLDEILGMSDFAIDPKHDDTGQASGKMLQYMGAGLPVACFDTENNRQYLGSGGVFSLAETPEALASAVATLAARKEDWKTIGEGNRFRAMDFSWDRTGEKLEGIYETLIDQVR